MIGVLTHHWAKKGSFDQARILLDGNGMAQSKAPGFVSRTTLLSREAVSYTHLTLPTKA